MALTPTPALKELLRKNLDDIKKPVAWPAGSYRGRITGHTLDESAQKKTPFYRFFLVATSPMDDVDQEDLKTALAGEPMGAKKFKKDFYITSDALWRVKEFLSSLDINSDGRGVGEVVTETTNCDVIFTISKKPSDSGEDFYNEVLDIKGASGE